MRDIIDFDRFTDEVYKAMETRYPDCRVDIRRVTKNNGVIYTGLTVTGDNESIYPTMYLEPFYEEFKGELPDQAVDRMCRVYESRRLGEPLALDYLRKYEEVRNELRCKLINYETNREMLEDVPHRRFMDLAIVPYYSFKNSGLNRVIGGEATFMIRNSHLEMWEVDSERVMDDAIGNTLEKERPSIKNMIELIRQLNPAFPAAVPEDDECCPMYVMTTEGGNGAVSMLYEEDIARFCESIDSDIYIIPSSINELILVPDYDIIPLAAINEMIKEINASEVEPVEVLSDHAYHFLRNGGYKEAQC